MVTLSYPQRSPPAGLVGQYAGSAAPVLIRIFHVVTILYAVWDEEGNI